MLEPAPEEIHYGCVIPRDLLYDVEADVWIRLEGDEAVIGMTDPAQTRCGKLVAVDFRRVGKTISRGRGLATIESAKWVGPVASPLSGEIVAVNTETFERDILIANRDPYGEGWLVRLRPNSLDEEKGTLQEWSDAFAAYKQRIDELEIRCFRCAD
ncbi:MAG TPA: glycine cleavage system protein H [Actinomycetota bacterium]|nr:glycine cleavage system protein H [Actinomycetota bacterium]